MTKHKGHKGKLTHKKKHHHNTSNQLDITIRHLHHYFSEKKYLEPANRNKTDLLLMNMIDTINTTSINQVSDTIRSQFLQGYNHLTTYIPIFEMIQDRTRNVPTQVLTIVTKYIELLDLSKLPVLATTKHVTMLLQELKLQLEQFTYISSTTIQEEIRSWIDKINHQSILDRIRRRVPEQLEEHTCEKLELTVSQWFEEFKAKLVAQS